MTSHRKPGVSGDLTAEARPEGKGAEQGEEMATPESREATESIEELHERVKTLQAEAEDAASKYLRLAADFENFRRRARQDQEDLIFQGSSRVLASLLPVLDDLHRSIEHAPGDGDETWRKGIELTIHKLEETLRHHGLEPIESLGQPFDPSLHEAIGVEESAEHPEDTVVTELRQGYRLHDRVLRPALVKVSRPPSTPPAGD